MAFTRTFLKALGLTEEQVDSVVEAHTETVDGLKSQMAGYKADAEKLEGVQKELDDLKANGDGEDLKSTRTTRTPKNRRRWPSDCTGSSLTRWASLESELTALYA